MSLPTKENLLNPLRQELPLLPDSMRRLPVDDRGYPVPWFVAWLEDGEEAPKGTGKPDFRVTAAGAFEAAIERKICWICGGRLTAYKCFVVGPMCAVNRTSSEPPSHRDCALFAATACPFLVRPHARRRENLPEGVDPAPGEPILRNPGVCLLWASKSFKVFRARGGELVSFGDPEWVRWFRAGREATREEVESSFDSGLPELREIAEREGGNALQVLKRDTEKAKLLLPEG